MGEDTGGVPGVGEPAPDFSLVSDTGEPISLSSFRGERHVIIHFVREFT